MVAGALIIGITALLWLKKRRTFGSDKTSNTITSLSTATTATTTTTSTYQTDMVTLFNNRVPLAIPGYLEIKPSEFRFISLLASGGGGSIYLVELLADSIRVAGATKKLNCVAKVPLGIINFRQLFIIHVIMLILL